MLEESRLDGVFPSASTLGCVWEAELSVLAARRRTIAAP